MKNSGWNHRLWRKKLDRLQVNEDAESSWSEMQSILDKNMPVLHHASGNAGGSTVKTIGSKIVSLTGYILPAAAMISIITYLAVKEPKPAKPAARPDKKELLLEKETIDTALDSKPAPEAGPFINPPGPKEEMVILSKKGITTELLKPGVRETLSVNVVQNTTAKKFFPSLNDIQLIVPLLPDTFLYQKLLILRQPNIIAVSQSGSAAAVSSTEETILRAIKDRCKKNRPVKIDNRKTESGKIKKQRGLNLASGLSAGAGTGVNIYRSGTTFFVEGALGYAINQRISINTGLRGNTARAINGVYNFENYKPTDSSVQHLSVADSRKLTVADVQLNLEYKISKSISFKAGPVVRFKMKETNVSSKLDTSVYHKGVIYDLQKINKEINGTQTSGIAIGFSAEVGIHIRQFGINAGYIKNLKPFKTANALGSYKNADGSFQLGIRYNFK